MESKLVMLIPCYNESVTIGDTIKSINKYAPDCSIVVCDNNSTDDTAVIASSFPNVTVCREISQGKGYAMQKLFAMARVSLYYSKHDSRNDVRYVFGMIDGDNTYSARDIQKMMQMIEEGYDCVVGVRSSYFDVNKKFINGLGNKLVRKLLKGNRDPLSGFRLFSQRFIELYGCDASGFDVEMDMDLWSIRNKMKIGYVDVDYKERPEGSYSKIKPIDGLKIIAKYLKYLAKR